MSNFEDIYDLIMEKKTTEEYRISKFKQKYHYNPTEKTIIVDGEKFNIDLDVKNPIMYVTDRKGNKVATVRQTGAELQSKDATIHLGNDFFKLKNPKRQDAVLQHEIGHTKMHSLNPNSKHLDKDFVHSNTINILAEEIAYNDFGFHLKDINPVGRKIFETAVNLIVKKKKYLGSATQKNFTKEERDKLLNILKKYSKAEHSNTNELEADRYSANRTSEKDLRGALRETHKHAKSDKSLSKTIDVINKMSKNKKYQIEKNRFVLDDMKKDMNIRGEESHKSRFKALKDPDMRKSKIYKPKPIKESMLKLDVYRSYEQRYITESEVDFLLESL